MRLDFSHLSDLASRLACNTHITHPSSSSNTRYAYSHHFIFMQCFLITAPSIHSFPLPSSSPLSTFLQTLPVLSGTHPQQPVRGEAVEDPELHSYVDWISEAPPCPPTYKSTLPPYTHPQIHAYILTPLIVFLYNTSPLPVVCQRGT